MELKPAENAFGEGGIGEATQKRHSCLLSSSCSTDRDKKAVVKANDMKQACAYMENLLASNRLVPNSLSPSKGLRTVKL